MEHVIYAGLKEKADVSINNDEDRLKEILYLDPHGHKVKYGMSGF